MIRAALPHLRQGQDPSILDQPFVVGPRAHRWADDLERAPTGPGGPDQVAHRRDRADPDQRPRTGRIATDRIAYLDGRRAEAAGVTPEEIARRTQANIPLGRYGDVAEIGRVGVFLLSPAASYVTGSIVAVDGGMIRSLP